MCTTCGCASSEPRIESNGSWTTLPAHGHEHDHAHSHDGEHGHDHAHSHEHDHAHEHDGGHSHEHSHVHSHAHNHDHAHDDDHSHEHTHAHSHTHDHVHGHDHAHADEHAHAYPHDDSHAPAHSHDHAPRQQTHPAPPENTHGRHVQLERDILHENNRHAAANRARLRQRGVFALNLVSSPGSGKTSLLVRTIAALKDALSVAVIEGDQQTAHDAERVRAAGAPAVQINTGKGCHLDAHMVGHALDRLPQRAGGLLLIENVGNLVCPASFDLGEAHKVVVLSVTEGEDKPLKYPDMFAAAHLMLLNKTDLLPHLDFDVNKALDYARRVNPSIEIFCVSARTGEGFDQWLDWIRAGCAHAQRDGQDAEAGSGSAPALAPASTSTPASAETHAAS